MKFKVGIVSRTKNRGRFLKRCLLSVQSQSYRDWVHIIINDGGDPGIVDSIVAEFKDKGPEKYVVVHNTKSLGMEAASNLGVEAALNSEYIAFLDDDDTWRPQFLAKTIAHLEQARDRKVGGVVTQSSRVFETISGDGSLVEVSRQNMNPDLHTVSLADLTQGNRYSNNAFVFRRQHYLDIGPFDKSLPVLGDWHFNLRFAARFQIDVLAEDLCSYHLRTGKTDFDSANTVVASVDQHQYYQNFIRQRFVSEDLQQQRLGIGLFMFLGELFDQNRQQLDRRTRILSPLNKLTKLWKS